MQYPKTKDVIDNFRKIGIERTCFFLSIFMMGTLLLSLGPSLQQHSVALIVSHESSLYSSVYKDAIINFPEFEEWLFSQSLIPFSIGSLAIAIGIYHSKTVRGAFTLTTVTGFGFWMILDIYNTLILAESTYSKIFECIISNIIGSLIYSSLFIAILCIAQKIKSSTSEHVLAAQLIRIATPVTTGILLVLLQYYVLTLIFNPAPANVDIKLIADSRLEYQFDDAVKETYQNEEAVCCEKTEKESHPKLEAFNGEFSGDFSFSGITENSRIDWNGLKNKDYKVSISVFDGCLSTNYTDLKENEWLSLQRRELNKISIQPDDGSLDLLTSAKGGHIEVPEKNQGILWLNKSKTEETIDLAKFIKTESTINYWTYENPLSLILRIPLISLDENSRSPESRKVSLTLQDEQIELTFSPSKQSKLKDICKQLNASSKIKNHEFTTDSILITLLVKITKPESNWFERHKESDNFKLTGLIGSSFISNIEKSKINKLFKPGLIQQLIFRGNIKSLNINGEEVKNTEGKWFSLYKTNIMAQIEESENGLQFTGTAKNIWVDQKRLNKTRWENLDGATQTVLSSLFGTAILAFLLFFSRCWKENENLSP